MQTHHKQRCTGRLLLMSLEASSISSSNSNWQKHNSQFLILSCITQQELELRISFPSFSCRWSSGLWHGLTHILPASKSGGLLKNLAGHLKICKAIPDLVQFERGSTEFLLTATPPANFLKVGWDHWPPFYCIYLESSKMVEIENVASFWRSPWAGELLLVCFCFLGSYASHRRQTPSPPSELFSSDAGSLRQENNSDPRM